MAQIPEEHQVLSLHFNVCTVAMHGHLLLHSNTNSSVYIETNSML
jgi:hypothetical protein